MSGLDDDCPESVSGHGIPDRQGRCPYCRVKYETVMPRPTRWAPVRAAIFDAYDRFYSPDWGSAQTDADPC